MAHMYQWPAIIGLYLTAVIPDGGIAMLSTVDKLSWAVQVESVPEGFRVIRSENGSNFYCSSCGRQVEP